MNLASALAGPNSLPPIVWESHNGSVANVAPPAVLFGNPSAASPANFFSNFKSIRLIPPPQITSTSTEYDNDVWYPVQFQENSSYYFGTPDEMVLYSAANATTNGTLGFEDSLNDLNATIELVTMIVTAILLGLIILATVIEIHTTLKTLHENLWNVIFPVDASAQITEYVEKATPEVWANTVQHTEKEIQRWWDREVAFDQEDVSTLIIDFGSKDSSADSDSDSD